MKRLLTVLALLGACGGTLTAFAAEQVRPAGPKGGRLLTGTEPTAEFHLEPDHTVSIAFYDASLQPVGVNSQVVVVIADAASGRETIEFEKKGDVLVSKKPLPEGDDYNLVVQIRQTAESKPQNHRFKLLTHICAGCSLQEYACTCDE